MEVKLKKDKLKRLLKEAEGKKVLILGDIMVDEFLYGRVERISPEAPVPVLEFERHVFLPGGAANAANNVRELGGNVVLCGYISNDEAGKKLIEELQRREIGIDGLMITKDRPTILKTRVVAHTQQVVRIDREKKGSIDASLEEGIIGFIREALADIDICLICDYIKGTVTGGLLGFIVSEAKALNKMIVMDTKSTDMNSFKGISVLTPNIKETEKLVGFKIEQESDIRKAGNRLNELLGSEAILVTRSEKGMSLIKKGDDIINLPALASQVHDVTGAGDTVAAAFSLILSAGGELEESAYIANLAAGVVVRKLGTATCTPQEVLHLYEEMEIENE